MSALETLRALASGHAVLNGVLGTCRLESGGVDAFGVEAVADAFRRAPMADAGSAIVIAVPGQLALFGETEAIVADLYGEAIGRLWRVGQRDLGPPEPAVGVAFDTDLRQARASVFASAEEHPSLAPAALERVIGCGSELLHDPTFPTFRARAFAVRAFGDETRGCALFAVHALAPNPRRVPQLSFAAARWDGATTQLVRDQPPTHIAQVRIVA